MRDTMKHFASCFAGLVILWASLALADDGPCNTNTYADIRAEVRAKYESRYEEWFDKYQEQYELELQEQQRQNQKYAAQLSESERLLELQSRVLTTADKNEQRFSEILSRWEALQRRHEKYLDSLERNMPKSQ